MSDRDELLAILRDLAQLQKRVELMAPAGRARALALTKLDEARHWTLDAFDVDAGAQAAAVVLGRPGQHTP
jgi:hypothetical protein